MIFCTCLFCSSTILSVRILTVGQVFLVPNLSPWTPRISCLFDKSHIVSAGKLMEQGTTNITISLLVSCCYRYMMLIRNSEHVYMIDRDNTVFAVRGLKFPSRKNPDESLRDTLVDGVSVITWNYHCSLHNKIAFCETLHCCVFIWWRQEFLWEIPIVHP